MSNKFHVYFKDMKFYGYTVPENVDYAPVNGFPSGTASAWIVVENDFAGFPPNDEDVTGLEPVRTGALKVTQAHEFMHALQFNINVYQSGWLMESHATWAEDAVYDGINDWHWYINTFLRHTRPAGLQPLRLRLRVLPELAERDLRRRHAAARLERGALDERRRRHRVRRLRRQLGADEDVRDGAADARTSATSPPTRRRRSFPIQRACFARRTPATR